MSPLGALQTESDLQRFIQQHLDRIGLTPAFVNRANSALSVRGEVSSGGAVAFGAGFSVVRNSAGVYTVTFDRAFASTPAIVVMPVGTERFFTLTAHSAASFQVTFANSIGGAGVDTTFDFIAEAV